MPKVTTTTLSGEVEELRAQMAVLMRRIEELEHPPKPEVAPPAMAAPAAPEPELATITEEELIAISAAIGAYLGVKPHIRQIRLVSSNAWAQQGRVSIQASHRLMS